MLISKGMTFAVGISSPNCWIALRAKADLKTHVRIQFMWLSSVTRANLELTETMRSREKRGTLFWVLEDKGDENNDIVDVHHQHVEMA